jgi:gas vesicle protein
MGAVMGIMLAPKSGKEIRQELFGSPLDILAEPGTEAETPIIADESEEDLKARIEETRARLKAEIESQHENQSSS